MSAHIPSLNFVVGLGALGVLIWYAIETMKLRKAAMEQVESMAKPCLTFWAKLRDPTDAILDMHGAVGVMVVRGSDAQFVVQNIGTGIALNVTYQFKSLDTPNARTSHAICSTFSRASPYKYRKHSTLRPTPGTAKSSSAFRAWREVVSIHRNDEQPCSHEI